MPFDFDRIIDHQLYLATQQCIHPYAQQRRVSSAPAAATAAAAAGPARTAGARKSSLGSLVSPWSPSGGGAGGRRSPVLYHHRSRPAARQGYSPVDLFFTAPVGIPARGGGGLYGGDGGEITTAQLARDDSSCSSLDQFVTAPVGDFTIGAAAAANGRLLPQHSNGSRPGSSDTDDWTFETASGGSGTGSFSGFDTTVDLTPSPPPSLQTGKIGTRVSTTTTTATKHPQRPWSAGPAPAGVPDPSMVSAITLQVQDLERAKRFYGRVFGAPCLSSEDGTSAALSLNGGSLVVTLREPSSDTRRGNGIAGGGGGVLLTVSVEDIGEVCRRLRSLAEEEGEVAGQRFAEPVIGRGGMQVVTFHDPAGYCWRVGQNLDCP